MNHREHRDFTEFFYDVVIPNLFQDDRGGGKIFVFICAHSWFINLNHKGTKNTKFL